jgi:cyanophycin synthetase
MFTIDILKRQFIRGPNRRSYLKSVVQVIIDIGILENHPSNHFVGLDEKLLSYLPGLESHRCDGGFINRIRQGTWMGHILEHMALEFQSIVTKCDSGFGRTRELKNGKPGVYVISISCMDEKLGYQCIEESKRLLLSILNQKQDDYCLYKSISTIDDEKELNLATFHLLEYAYKINLPFIHLYDNLFQFQYGNQQKRIWQGYGPNTTNIGVEVSCDKHQTKTMIAPFIRVPEGKVCSYATDAVEFFESLKRPVVLKPLEGNKSRSVFLHVTSKAEVLKVFSKIQQQGFKDIIIEEMLEGSSYRVLVIGDKIVAVIQYKTVFVKGDGKSTIQKLVESQINKNQSLESYLVRWNIDLSSKSNHPQFLHYLEKMGKTPDFILKKDEIINIGSNGSFTKDVLETIHPQTKLQILVAVQAIGLDIAGLDVIAKDISIPLDDQDGGVCEINAKPSWSDHFVYPSKNINLAKEIIEYSFLENKNNKNNAMSMFPILSFVGAMSISLKKKLEHSLLKYYSNIGWATEHGIFVNSDSLLLDDEIKEITYDDAQKVLIHPDIEIAVIQTNNFMDIEKNGLPFLKSRLVIVDNLAIQGVDEELMSVVLDSLSSDGLLMIQRGVSLKRIPTDINSRYDYKDENDLIQRIEEWMTMLYK